MMFMILVALFGSFWRVVDGSDIKPKNWQLWPLAFVPVICMTHGVDVAGAYLIGWVAMLDGFHGWHEPGYMRMRFTGYAALACAVFDTHLLFIPAAFLVGMMYPALHKAYERGFRLPKFWLFNNYTTYCEALTGFVMLGLPLVMKGF